MGRPLNLSAVGSSRVPAEAAAPGPPGRRLRALVALLHPVPSLATALIAVACGALFGAGDQPWNRLVAPLALLLLLLLCQQFAVSLHNDWCDRDLDAVAKPDRAIPAGHASPAAVRAAAWGLALASLAVSALFGVRMVVLDALWLASGFAYNAALKRSPWSWLPFAVAFPVIPLFGAAAVDRWPALWWSLFVTGLPLVAAIHLADSLPDFEADAAAGVRGLAQAMGQRRARLAAVAAVLLGGGAASAAGVAGENLVAVVAGGLAVVGALVGYARPPAHRPAVTAGAAAGALGWIALIAP